MNKILSVILLLSLGSCHSVPEVALKQAEVVTPAVPAIINHTSETAIVLPPETKTDAASIAARAEVPILCYHQIREWKPSDSRGVKDMVVPPSIFREQMKLLADSGYHTVLPDQVYAWLTNGTPLPSKPVMLTFDDGDVDQYNIAYPEMKKYGFKGVFFVMTVSLGRSIYMKPEQVKALSDDGHIIACHTWNHENVRKYKEGDWDKQIAQSAKQLEAITGKPVRYFAYPFGAWNKAAIPELKKQNMIAAFQLSTRIDDQDPLYTIRRMIVPGDWSASTMLRVMKRTFKS